ncbi:hypothetical protein SHIRM173S_07613 [Streptomyces hirsutus]
MTGGLLLLPPQGGLGATPALGSAAGTGTSSSAGILVHNVETACQKPRTNTCALSLAYTPYRPCVTSNSADRVWHHDLLHARCTIANGVTVTDENHKHTSIWIQVTRNGNHLWLPGIRVRPDHLNQLTTILPTCAPWAPASPSRTTRAKSPCHLLPGEKNSTRRPLMGTFENGSVRSSVMSPVSDGSLQQPCRSHQKVRGCASSPALQRARLGRPSAEDRRRH